MTQLQYKTITFLRLYLELVQVLHIIKKHVPVYSKYLKQQNIDEFAYT